MTNYDNPEYVRAAMAEGASGYLLKDSTPAEVEKIGANLRKPHLLRKVWDYHHAKL